MSLTRTAGVPFARLRRDVRRSAFFWLVLYLAALELIARGLVPYTGHPAADQVRRNPTQDRGYVEYLDAGSPAEPLIVLIGNSQAVAPEIEDPEAIYPARLDDELRRRWPAARLENWSSGGLRTAELELLSMKAVRRGADRGGRRLDSELRFRAASESRLPAVRHPPDRRRPPALGAAPRRAVLRKRSTTCSPGR